MRFGLIGCGAIGALRAEALRQTPDAVLAAVTDPMEERAQSVAAITGARVLASVEELAAQPDLDAVIVSTPPHLHLEYCLQALAAGKHVLCEKPLAPTTEACLGIVEAAERNRRVLATGFNYRFYPAVVKARELIATGRIGDVDHVVSVTGHPGGPEFTHPWVHDASIMGGGALMDNGIHLADLTLHFLGGTGVGQACGEATDRIWAFPGSEDNGYVLVRTPEGRVGSLHASWTQWRGYKWQVEIVGGRGSIRVQYPPMLTVLHERPLGAAARGRRHMFVFPGFQIRERLRSHRWTIVQSFVAEHRDFAARIDGRCSVGATGQDGLQAVRLARSGYGAAGLAG